MSRTSIRSQRTLRRILAGSAVGLAALASAGVARAQDSATSAKQGPIMANLKIGPAIGVADFARYNAFALELEGGYALIGGNNGYITFSPNFSFGDFTLVTLPVGFQYEFALPVEKLYAYGRATLGVTVATEGGPAVFHIGPHIGAKYQLTPMFHVGAEPLSLPIYFNKNGVGMQYRILFYGGVDF